MPLVSEIDFGTPASLSEKMVTLTIDGNEITVLEGTSVMRASMEAGIEVPKLCATDMIDAFGSCRLCLVEVEGRAGTPASCTISAKINADSGDNWLGFNTIVQPAANAGATLHSTWFIGQFHGAIIAQTPIGSLTT